MAYPQGDQLTSLPLVDAVQGDVFALLRQPNQCKHDIELVPSQTRAFLSRCEDNLQDPRLVATRHPARGHQRLHTAYTDTVAHAIAGV